MAAVFGVKGQLVLTHKLGKKSSLKGLDVLFVEMKTGEMLPYFIVETTIKNEAEIYIQLEGVNTREAAQALVNRPVWLPEADFKKYAAKTAAISLLGYHIIDGSTDLGEILEVIEQPHQILCRIDWKGKEALIPLHEDFVRKVDARKKQVLVELPEGLMDVF
jgi:16S rRNA processing protein RimM